MGLVATPEDSVVVEAYRFLIFLGLPENWKWF